MLRITVIKYDFNSRYLNDKELEDTDTIKMQFIKKDDTYTLTFTGDLTDKAGKIKAVGKNKGGEAKTEATLTIQGRAPKFGDKPIKCTVLEGKYA